MPTVGVVRDHLFEIIGKKYTEEEFDEVCFKFGIELDDIVENCEDHSGETVYKIDIPANRYDLLCVEGIGRALKIFTSGGDIPILKLTGDKPTTHVLVHKQTSQIRPFFFGAVLRNITFTDASYKSFIDLQDKLHQTVGRNRTLVAIGTHDMDTIKVPYTYEALPPRDINFMPLYSNQVLSGDKVIDMCDKHQQLRHYTHIIKESPIFPIIYDNNRVVLSMPPIINGDHTKITLKTKNVFIDVTATDYTKGQTVLNTLVAMFSAYCDPPFLVEPISVQYEAGHSQLGGKTFVYPDLSSRTELCSVTRVRNLAGTPGLKAADVAELLSKMMLKSRVIDEDTVEVHVPITRTDILHECDLAEDVAIAFGFNRLPQHEYPIVTGAPLNALTNQLRRLLSTACYHEALNWGLCSTKEAFAFLSRTWTSDLTSGVASQQITGKYDSSLPPASVSNPKTREFEIVRTSLIPGLLKTLASNKGRELPIRLFELGDVVFFDVHQDTGARNARYCCVIFANNDGAGLEEVHGALDILMTRLGLTSNYGRDQVKREAGNDVRQRRGSAISDCEGRCFELIPSQDETFLIGRQVHIRVLPDNLEIGVMGTLHPNVLKAFGLSLPTSVLEINVEAFLEWIPENNLFDD
eukprot:GHVQ01013074.1.p1 GENE.GHVQ01013074.1~~GHVQ01013074.1.p1  ORF type:complete len:636 (+),score=53.30 GHVQ01013074.1:176-2083(+)